MKSTRYQRLRKITSDVKTYLFEILTLLSAICLFLPTYVDRLSFIWHEISRLLWS